MIELDDIDRRILGALQGEGRLPMVDLANRVGLSPTPCQRRVKRLEEEGVIDRYAALERDDSRFERILLLRNSWRTLRAGR